MEKGRFVIKLAGHQYLASPGAKLVVDRLKEPVGAVVKTLDLLSGDTVSLEVLETRRGPKIKGLKFKNKTRYLRRWGHRQSQTVLQVSTPTSVTPASKKRAEVRK